MRYARHDPGRFGFEAPFFIPEALGIAQNMRRLVRMGVRGGVVSLVLAAALGMFAFVLFRDFSYWNEEEFWSPWLMGVSVVMFLLAAAFLATAMRAFTTPKAPPPLERRAYLAMLDDEAKPFRTCTKCRI